VEQPQQAQLRQRVHSGASSVAAAKRIAQLLLVLATLLVFKRIVRAA
jgi:hypothetical protein